MENTWILLGALIIGFTVIIGLLIRSRRSNTDDTNNAALLESQNQFREANLRLQDSQIENKRLETQSEFLDTQLSQIKQEQVELRQQLTSLLDQKQALSEENIRLQSALKEERNINAERQRSFEQAQRKQEESHAQIQEQMNNQFKNMAQDILEKNSKDLQEKSTKDLNLVLAPLKDQLGNFDKLVRETSEKEVARHQDMKNELKNINDTALKMSKEASDLTNSLKGQSKVRGNWGEMVLEHSLELSGLRKDHEYTLQDSYRDEEGKIVYPDAIVKMPGNRSIIIDSKLSLIAYDSYMNCDDEDERQQYLASHVAAVKTHIKQLSSKNYQDLQELHSPDFVVMFVPLESALMQALEQEPNLAAEALQNNIGIASPSTIMMVLRTIEHLWRTERQIENAEEISRRGTELHTKFSNFVGDLMKVRSHLDKSNEALDESFKKLSTGRGNLVSQAEKLEELGVKVKKPIAIESSDDSSDKILKLDV